MNHSAVSLCSSALMKLGDNPITSLTDASHRARVCNQHFDTTRKAVLRDHTWRDSMKRAQLAQLTEPPAWEYTYSYQLPHDFMRLTYTSLGRYDTFRLEGQTLLANVGEVFIVYVYDNEDLTSYDDLHIDALIAKLAFELSIGITGKGSYRDAMAQEYFSKLTAAKAVNGQEVQDASLDVADLIDVR